MPVLRYFILIALAIAVAVLVRVKEQDDLDRALKAYRAGAHIESFNTANQINTRMNSIYQELCTIAKLPGIRFRDEHTTSLDEQTQQTLQELYSSLADNNGISEIHIITTDFDPTNTTPSARHRPLVTFDSRTANVALSASNQGNVERHKVPVNDAPEYDLMSQQLTLLKTQYPEDNRATATTTPALLGPEVVTRDNSRYLATDPDDRNRSGIIYSVPIYDRRGLLKGMVSAVLLSNSIRDIFYDGYDAIHSATHEYVAGRQEGSVWLRVLPFIEADTPDPKLLYSEVQLLEIPDAQGGWTLWSWEPDIFYDQREDVRAARRSALLAYASLVVLTIAVIVVLRVLEKRREMLLNMNQHLADQVKLRTAELEQAVTVAEHATKAKSQFLANMSHEIRTPMNGVVGMLDIITNAGVDQKVRGYVDIARQSANSLLRIIDDILDYSKIEAGKIVIENIEFDPIQVVEDVAALLAAKCHGKGLALNCDTPTEMTHMVIGDPTRLRQVLLNLVGNAIKFTEQGQVSIQLVCEPLNDMQRNLRFAVSDTGIGMNPEVRDKLFTAFTQADESTTRRFGGTGLGLIISQRLVELMGGKINAHSTQGKGSRFEFTVPVTLGDVVPSVTAPATDIQNKRVLIVDDNITDCMILQHHLDHWQLQHHTVHTAAAAMQALCTGLNGKPYDIALLDMVLPDQDGLTLSSIIQADAQLRSIKRILLTSVTSLTQDQLKKHHISALHLKPVKPRDLRRSISLAPAASSIEKSAKQIEPVHSSMQVLVVDDNEINQTVVALMLERMGAKVTCAGNGEEALQALTTNRFDLLLLDCHMPVMDGYEAIRRLREKEQITNLHQLVVALTASAMQEDRERCVAAGMDDFLTKPVTLKELQRVLNKWLPGKFLAVA